MAGLELKSAGPSSTLSRAVLSTPRLGRQMSGPVARAAAQKVSQSSDSGLALAVLTGAGRAAGADNAGFLAVVKTWGSTRFPEWEGNDGGRFECIGAGATVLLTTTGYSL